MRIFPVFLTLLPSALWADDIPLMSDVSSVTLFPDGATIVRSVPFSAPQGRHELILTDLPQGTPLQSVRVAVSGAVLGSVTARNDFVPPRDEDTSAAIQAAEDEVERLEDDLRRAEADVEAIRLEAEAAGARVAFLKQLGEGEGVAGLDPAALRDLIGLIGEETLTALQEAHDARQRAGAADRDLEELREELEKARQALRALVPEDTQRAMLAVAVDADLVALEAASDGDHSPAARAQLVDTVLESGSDPDPSAAESGDVVDAVLEGAVAEHVVDETTGGDHDPVAGLFDPLDVALHPTFVDLPHAAQVRNTGGEGLPASVEGPGWPHLE